MIQRSNPSPYYTIFTFLYGLIRSDVLIKTALRRAEAAFCGFAARPDWVDFRSLQTYVFVVVFCSDGLTLISFPVNRHVKD